MAMRFIKSKQDIYEVFKDQAGNINPGITGEVYTNLENLGTAGEKIMYQQQKGALGVVAELEKIVIRSLKQAALYDEIADRLDTSALGLSGGQQQRLCIARC